MYRNIYIFYCLFSLSEKQLDLIVRVWHFSRRFLSPVADAFMLALKIRREDLGKDLFSILQTHQTNIFPQNEVLTIETDL